MSEISTLLEFAKRIRAYRKAAKREKSGIRMNLFRKKLRKAAKDGDSVAVRKLKKAKKSGKKRAAKSYSKQRRKNAV